MRLRAKNNIIHSMIMREKSQGKESHRMPSRRESRQKRLQRRRRKSKRLRLPRKAKRRLPKQKRKRKRKSLIPLPTLKTDQRQ